MYLISMSKSQAKLIALLTLLTLSIIGFMIRLPNMFHHFDKELHTLFYASAFIVLGLLYPDRWLGILIALLLFGIAIEYAQEYSNKIAIRMTGKRIHGRFDSEDVRSNIVGLGIGVLLFGVYRLSFNKKAMK